jgi:hypothetical protein
MELVTAFVAFELLEIHMTSLMVHRNKQLRKHVCHKNRIKNLYEQRILNNQMFEQAIQYQQQQGVVD